jgi:hypothetical protein
MSQKLFCASIAGTVRLINFTVSQRASETATDCGHPVPASDAIERRRLFIRVKPMTGQRLNSEPEHHPCP